MVLHTYESRLFGAGEEIDNARERYIKKKKKKKKNKKREKKGWKIHLARVKCIATVRVKIRSGKR